MLALASVVALRKTPGREMWEIDGPRGNTPCSKQGRDRHLKHIGSNFA